MIPPSSKMLPRYFRNLMQNSPLFLREHQQTMLKNQLLQPYCLHDPQNLIAPLHEDPRLLVQPLPQMQEDQRCNSRSPKWKCRWQKSNAEMFPLCPQLMCTTRPLSCSPCGIITGRTSIRSSCSPVELLVADPAYNLPPFLQNQSPPTTPGA